MARPRRTYDIKKIYVVLCSECNEDITDDDETTKAGAEEARRAHEAWHQRDDAELAAWHSARD